MVTEIRFVPGSDGIRRADVMLGDLCFFHISEARWLKVEPRSADNPRDIETMHHPPDMIESVTTGSL